MTCLFETNKKQNTYKAVKDKNRIVCTQCENINMCTLNNNKHVDSGEK